MGRPGGAGMMAERAGAVQGRRIVPGARHARWRGNLGKDEMARPQRSRSGVWAVSSPICSETSYRSVSIRGALGRARNGSPGEQPTKGVRPMHTRMMIMLTGAFMGLAAITAGHAQAVYDVNKHRVVRSAITGPALTAASGSTRALALVNGDGSIARSKGIVSVTHIGTGEYLRVPEDRDRCRDGGAGAVVQLQLVTGLRRVRRLLAELCAAHRTRSA